MVNYKNKQTLAPGMDVRLRRWRTMTDWSWWSLQTRRLGFHGRGRPLGGGLSVDWAGLCWRPPPLESPADHRRSPFSLQKEPSSSHQSAWSKRTREDADGRQSRGQNRVYQCQHLLDGPIFHVDVSVEGVVIVHHFSTLNDQALALGTDRKLNILWWVVVGKDQRQINHQGSSGYWDHSLGDLWYSWVLIQSQQSGDVIMRCEWKEAAYVQLHRLLANSKSGALWDAPV